MLRASNRATADPGYDLLGLPYHRGDQADQAPLIPGEPVELVMDLYPTSNLFDAGHRIWLTVYRQAGRASYLEVPVVDSPHQ